VNESRFQSNSFGAAASVLTGRIRAAAGAALAERGSLRAAAARATLASLAGDGASQALRFASNLILTRLLFPEAFGLMALVNVALQGLEMFSDFGIKPSVIQHRKGNQQTFLNTAWTIQVVRGFGLFGALALLTYPLAWLYAKNDPLAWSLLWLLPVAGVGTIFAGFKSTRLFTLNRDLQLGRLMAINLGSQAIGIAVMIVWALLAPTVWALVGGSLVGAASKTVMSHALVPGPANRLEWNSEVARELFRFGKWIFASTLFAFVAGRGDRLILGGMLSAGQLGVYSIAVSFAQIARKVIGQHSQRVTFPVYAKLIRKGDADRLIRAARRVKIAILTAALPPICALAIVGPWLIEFLYDDRYADAGWMLRILAVGMVPMAISATSSPVLLASGDSFRNFLVAGTRAASLLVGMAIGGWLFGEVGLVIGVASARFLSYPVLAASVRRYGLWMPGIDLVAALLSGAVIAAGLLWL